MDEGDLRWSSSCVTVAAAAPIRRHWPPQPL